MASEERETKFLFT